MRTARRILGFAAGAAALSTVLLSGTAQAAAAPVAQASGTGTSSTCTDNLNWDGVPACQAAQQAG